MSTNHFIRVYSLLKIVHNRYPGINTLVVLIISILLQFQITFSRNVLCPPYYVYLESGNDCLFNLDTCGNSSYAREQCDEKTGMLVSMIYNVKHFHDVCEFAKKRLPKKSSFYLGAYRNEDKFIWELTDTDVSFPPTLMFTDKGYDCLEMVLSDKGCHLDDSPCEKQTWPICEFPHVNPCAYDNGGCKEQCIPRHRGDRKCVASNEYTNQGSYVEVRCDANSIIINGLCVVKEKSEGSFNYQMNYCRQTFNTVLLSLSSKEKYNKFCLAFQNTLTTTIEYFYLNGVYDKIKNKVLWNIGYVSEMHEWCEEFDSNLTSNVRYTNIIMLKVSSVDCCLLVDAERMTAKAACELQSPNVCKDKSLKVCKDDYRCVPKSGYRQFECVGPCMPGYTMVEQKCVDIDECDFDNGGCHYGCVNTLGSRECSCFGGYQLYNETECLYTDKCMDSDGKDGCPPKIEIHADGLDCDAWKERRRGEHEYGDKYRKISDEVIIGALIGLFVLCFLISACLKFICFMFKKSCKQDSVSM